MNDLGNTQNVQLNNSGGKNRQDLINQSSGHKRSALMNAKSLGFTVILALVVFASLVLVTTATTTPTEADVGGFLLPWAGDENINGSLHEVNGGTTALYAMDVSDDFDILAPKDGVIVDFKDDMYSLKQYSCNVQHAGLNYLVLGHGPYQFGKYDHYSVYYHIARHSVQDLGLSIGNRVKTGQVIAHTGSTGVVAGSTGIHLHFYVTRDQPGIENKLLSHCRNKDNPDDPNATVSDDEYRGVPDSVNPVTYGFEENYNMWPPPTDLPASYNYQGYQQNLCIPDIPYISTAILYEHVDYGGKCKVVEETPGTSDLEGLQVSSVYINYPSCAVNASDNIFTHLPYTTLIRSNPDLRVYGGENWNDRINWVQVNCPGPAYFIAGMTIGGAYVPPPLPSWLLELNFSEVTPLEIQIHTKVDAVAGVYDAHRVLVDGGQIYETGAGESNFTWNTYGLNSGAHAMVVEYRRLSDGGNWANALRYEMQYFLDEDTTPPNTTVSLSGTEGNNNWYVSTVDGVLTPTDNAGVATTYYQIDGGTVNEGTTFTLSQEGIYNVCFWSVDVNGNVESQKCVQVKIDWTPPVTTGEVFGSRDMLGVFRSAVDNTLSATDNLSGVDTTSYSLDNGNTWNLYGGVFTLSDNGAWEYLFRSVDVAGNIETAISSGVIGIKRFAALANSLTSDRATTLQMTGVAHSNGNASFTDNVTVHLQTLEYLGQLIQSGNVSFTIDNLIHSGQAEGIPLYPLSFYKGVCTFIQGPIIVQTTSPVYNECWYVDDNVTLEITGATGNLTIISEGTIYDRSTNSHLSAWDTTNGILFYARKGYTTESTGAVYNGIIYAPFASTVGAYTNFTLAGGQFANNVSLANGTTLNAQQAAGFPASVYPLPLVAYTPTVPNIIYVSSMGGGTVGGISTADEDILAYNREADSYAMYIDGSDVGLSYTDIDAFAALPDGTFLMSFDASISISPLGTVYDADIVRFTPTSLGANTAGSFSWYFDGSDVGLTTSDEDVDAIGFTPDGKLVVSTLGSFSVTGVTGNDEDLIVFTATSLGANTAGSWAIYFDGSDVGLNESSYEDINGVWIDPATGQIYLTTVGSFSVNGVSGDGADIFVCTPSSLGSNTACAYGPGLYWDGSKNGFSGKVLDSIAIQK